MGQTAKEIYAPQKEYLTEFNSLVLKYGDVINLSIKHDNLEKTELLEEVRLDSQASVDNILLIKIVNNLQLFLFYNEDILDQEDIELILGTVNETLMFFEKTESNIYKIEKVLNSFKDYYLDQNEKNKEVLINNVKLLNSSEMHVLRMELSDLAIYKSVLSKDLIKTFYLTDIDNGDNISLIKFWNFGDQKIDVIDQAINNRTLNALEDIFLFENLKPGEKYRQLENIIRDFFYPVNILHEDKDDSFQFIQKMLTHPDISRYAERIIIKYWFAWENELEKKCSEVNFENTSKENIRAIVTLLDIIESSYNMLIVYGLEPNENDVDYMLDFIVNCQKINNYFLDLKIKRTANRICENISNYEFFYADDITQRSGFNLTVRAMDKLGQYPDQADIMKEQMFGDWFVNLSLAKIGDEMFHECNISPKMVGYFDNHYNLIKVKFNGEIMDFSNLIKLNYKEALGEGDFYDVMYLQNLKVKSFINEDFEIDLSKLNLRVQNQFLNFIKNRHISEIEEIKQFLFKTSNSNLKLFRIISFLSLESGDEDMGERILSIGKNLDQESADLVFAKYAEIVDSTENIRVKMREVFVRDVNFSDEEVEKIVQNLIGKANQLLVEFSGKSEQGKMEVGEVLNILDNYKRAIVLQTNALRTIKKYSGRRDISLADFAKTSFGESTAESIDRRGKIMPAVYEITEAGFPVVPASSLLDMVKNQIERSGGSLTQEEEHNAETIMQMLEVYRRNYEHKPELQKKLLSGFVKKLKEQKDKTRIYTIKEYEIVMAFCRFDDLPSDDQGRARKYFGSFNVRVKDSGIGDLFLQEKLLKEAGEMNPDNDMITEADTDPSTEICSYYIEKCGFVVVGADENYEDTGEKIFHIERRRENLEYFFRNKSMEEIKNNYEPGNFKEGNKIIVKLPFGSNELFDSATELLEQGFKMTRFVIDKNKEAYCCFEK